MFNGDLQILDVSNPADPKLTGSTDIAYDGTAVFVWGSHAYVTTLSSLQIIDVSDPANPRPTGSIDTPGYGQAVFVLGPLVYMADGDCGLSVALWPWLHTP